MKKETKTTIRTFIWVFVMITSLLGFGVLILSFLPNINAIQQSTAFSLGIALAVIPYCFARALSECLEDIPESKSHLDIEKGS